MSRQRFILQFCLYYVLC